VQDGVSGSSMAGICGSVSFPRGQEVLEVISHLVVAMQARNNPLNRWFFWRQVRLQLGRVKGAGGGGGATAKGGGRGLGAYASAARPCKGRGDDSMGGGFVTSGYFHRWQYSPQRFDWSHWHQQHRILQAAMLQPYWHI
jgi:hypothetical protein